MTPQPMDLARGRWNEMPLMEQMANIGSEVERALNWQAKNNEPYSQKAYERALELVDLTIEGSRGYARLKELSRMREALADYFSGDNEFSSTSDSWKKYFLHFAYGARRDR